jgi:hypothetical protein
LDAQVRIAFIQTKDKLEQMTEIANFWAGVAGHYAALLDRYRNDPLWDLFQ